MRWTIIASHGIYAGQRNTLMTIKSTLGAMVTFTVPSLDVRNPVPVYADHARKDTHHRSGGTFDVIHQYHIQICILTKNLTLNRFCLYRSRTQRWTPVYIVDLWLLKLWGKVVYLMNGKPSCHQNLDVRLWHLGVIILEKSLNGTFQAHVNIHSVGQFHIWTCSRRPSLTAAIQYVSLQSFQHFSLWHYRQCGKR